MTKFKLTPDDRRLARSGLGTAAVSGGRVAAAFALSVVLARALGPAEYGTYTVAVSLATILSVPGRLGFPYPLVREIAAHRATGRAGLIRRMYFRALKLTTTASVLLAAGTAGAVVYVLNVNAYETALLWGAILIPILSLEIINASTLRGLGHVPLGALSAPFLREATFLAVLPAMILLQGSPIEDFTALAAHVLAGVLAVVVGFVWALNRLPGQLSPVDDAPPSRMVGAGAFASLEALDLAAGHLDVMVLALLLGPSDVGVYKIALAVGAAILVIDGAASQVSQPEFAGAYRNGDHEALKHVTRRYVQLTSAVGLVVLLLIGTAGQAALEAIFGAAYADAYVPLLVIAVGMTMRFMAGPAAQLLTMTGHERSVIGVQAGSSLATVVLVLALTPLLGIVGAAVAYATGLALPQMILARRARSLLNVRTVLVGAT